jgi:MoxR-like ATPase
MTADQPLDAVAWARANHRYLRGELERLRLLLRRRVLWLRRQWARDQGPGFQGLAIADGHADRLLVPADAAAAESFQGTDPEAMAIQSSLLVQEAELADQARRLADAGQPPAIDVLVHRFGLSAFDRDLALICLAPEMDPSFELLYAYVQDDVGRKYPTLGLALDLFVGDDDAWLDARHRLTPAAPLRRFLLVLPDPGAGQAQPALSAPLRLSQRAADFLLGVNQPDPRIAGLLRPLPPALLSPSAGDVLQLLGDRLRDDATWPMVNLVGPPGAGKRALARALCERLGLQIHAVDLASFPEPLAERQELIGLVEREAVLAQFALYVDATWAAGVREPGGRPAGCDSIERLGVFLVVGSDEAWPSERATISVRLQRPDTQAQRDLWRRALQEVPNSLNGEVEALVQQFDLGPATISRVIAAALGRAGLRFRGDGELSAADLWQACRDHTGLRLDELAQRIAPCHAWPDIVLPEDVLRHLREIAAQVPCRGQVYDGWGFGAKLNRGRGISALFCGSSGTGKTLAAEILAGHLDLDLYRIDLAGVVSKYIGETEKNLRRVFDAAEESGCILFFDEADALFGKRSEVKDSHDRYANIEIDYLLQRMEDYRGLAILATNVKSHVDPAFLRRLRFVVDFPFPDPSDRARIWQRVLPAAAAVARLDYSRLSRLEIPGGSIQNIAVNAAFLAAAEGAPIEMRHLLHAARREYSKIGKLIVEAELRPG